MEMDGSGLLEEAYLSLADDAAIGVDISIDIEEEDTNRRLTTKRSGQSSETTKKTETSQPELLEEAYLALVDEAAEFDICVDTEETQNAYDSLLPQQDDEEEAEHANIPQVTDPLDEKVTSVRNGEYEPLSTVSQFTSILSRTGIEGPRHLQAYNLTRQSTKIGRGAQFTAFRQRNDVVIAAQDVVIKRVNVPLARPGNGEVTFSSSPEYRFQLRALELELLALCNPRLRNHRNIVHLEAWGYDYPSPDMPVPVLFMEAALMPLSDFLKPENGELLGDQPDDVRYQLALDTMAGIQALHSLLIVHGDIKPDNILVFRQTVADGKVPFCAKISDFGVCLDLETPQSVLTVEDYRGTPGWIPPELQDDDYDWSGNASFEPDIMFRFDSYSLGLLILSIFVSSGQPVTLQPEDYEEPADVAIDLLERESSLKSSDLRRQLMKAMTALLAENPWQRALPNTDLLKSNLPGYMSWLSISQLSSPNHSSRDKLLDKTYRQGPEFWYHLDESVINELEHEYTASVSGSKPSPFAADVLLGLAQSITARRMDPNAGRYIDRLITYVTESARRGYSPARAMYAQIMHAHGRNPEFSGKTLKKWTMQAISEGYLFADTSSLSKEDIETARRRFRNSGGFCTDPFLQKPDVINMMTNLANVIERHQSGRHLVDNMGNTLLHAAAVLGCVDVVRWLVEKGKISVDVENDNLETPIYKACQAGQVEAVHCLIDLGADACIATRTHRVTALHWIFTFPDHSIQQVATRLVREAGAEVDAIIEPEMGMVRIDYQERIQLVHFPFELPFGTPLHWAAFARNEPAINALLDLGADVNATYHDFNTGTTPLALAIWYGEVEIANLLLSRGADGTAKDSKNRNALHMMTFYSPDRHGCLPYPWHYWIRHGNWNEHLQKMTELVMLLVAAGAGIEALDGVYPRSTPLRLASENMDGGAACALLAAGADANARKETYGDTVLHCWAGTASSSLAYPESYTYVFESISGATTDVNIFDNHDKEAPIHILAKAPHSAKDGLKALKILLNHRPPADINLPNGRGETALYIALGNAHFDEVHEKWAFSFVDASANLLTRTKEGKDILCSVVENTILEDDDSLRLIRRLLSHIAGTHDDDAASMHCIYTQKFLPHPSSIVTLSAASTAGRLKTTKLLLDLGVSNHPNLNLPYRPPSDDDYSPNPFRTVLDTALAAALAARQHHLDRLAVYKPGPERRYAVASNALYENLPLSSAAFEQGVKVSPARAAEAYASFPAILQFLRDRGAKRSCELDLVPDAEVLDVDYLPKLRPRGDASYPDLWDVKCMYELGYTWATVPDCERWKIGYELSRRLSGWRETLVGELRWMYGQGIWRPHLQMLKDAVGFVERCDGDNAVTRAEHAKSNARDGEVQVPDVEFLRNMLDMLATVNQNQPGESSTVLESEEHTRTLDNKQQRKQQSSSTSSWVEVTESQKYGRQSGSKSNSSERYVVEVELLDRGKRLGETRRTARDILD